VRTTIVLLGTNEAPLLRRSLPAALEQPGAEVLLVDNASGDETPELAREHGVRYLRLERRLGYTDAINAAIEASEGDSEAVLLLNADCFLEPGFLAAAVARLGEPGVGSVAPKLVRTEGPEPEQRVDALDAAGMTIDRRRKNTLVGHGRPALAFDAPSEAFGADGAAVLYRRETLEDCRIEGDVFDRDMERWASDVDLAWRARLFGWRCVYEPRAVAYHVRYYSPSTRAAMPPGDRRLQFRNRYLMMVKNDTAREVARDLPRLAAYETAALGYALLRERSLLGGYREAWRLLPGARRRRALVQARRRERGVRGVPFGLEPRP
jgi:GT2 family glycosyltransferase